MVNLLLGFSEIFNVFRITVFFFFLRIQENFQEKLKTIVTSKLVDKTSNNFKGNHGFMDAYNKVSSKTLSLFWFVIYKFDDVTS